MNQPWAPFVPFLSRLQVERIQALGRTRESPASEELHGTMLFLDIVAFSEVTERLGDQGIRGAEILSEVLHAYFRPVLNTIRAHGGDVLFFAGDALGVLWRAHSASSDDIEDAAIRAAQCALEIQALVPMIQPASGSHLSLRVALGTGALEALEIGGRNGRWMQMVRGDALERVRRADQLSEAGIVVLSTDCLRILEPAGATSEPFGEGHHRLLTLPHGLDPKPLPDLELDAEVGGLLRQHLAEVIASRIEAGGEDFSAEFRQVTVLFVNLAGTGEGAQQIDVETLHRGVLVAQEQAARFEGVVYLLLEDDKGTSLITVFGLPGTSHADDPTRALLAARAIDNSLRELGISPTSGVATGQVYCGPQGGDRRRGALVLGSTVNLASRLMSMAREHGILCDGTTRKLAGRGITFDEAGWTTPKGFKEPVALFAPRATLEPTPAADEDIVVVGRARELAMLARTVDTTLADGKTRLVAIRATAGAGKSALLEAAALLAQQRSVNYVAGMADSFETGTAYYAFRDVARDWFDISSDDAVAGQVKAVEALSGAPDLIPLVPLLGQILGLDFPDTDFTDKLRGQTRAQNLRRVLLHVAAERTSRTPMILALEDGHWMDEASLALIFDIVLHVPRAIILLSTRPTPEPMAGLDALLDREDTEVLELEALGRQDTEELIRNQLGISEVAPDALDFVCQRAEGNPLFAREILRSLRETGGIRIRASRVELVGSREGTSAIPPTLEGVITSRIDRLDPSTQGTLKIAAVLGRTFEPDVLLAVHQASPDPEALDEHLDALVHSALLSRDETGPAYLFTHALTHEAAYNLLAFAHRETLHREVAETLEHLHRDNLDQVRARLGYHFSMAQMADRAVPHLAAAGEAAVDAYASNDAIRSLTAAMELDKEVRGKLHVDPQRARWSRLIAQAYYNQDKHVESANWYSRAIRRAGATPKRGVMGLLGTLLRGVFTPEKFGESPRKPLEPEESNRMMEGLAAGRELSAVHLWQCEFIRAALNGINLARVARLVGPSAESAEAISTFGFLLSVAGLRRQGEKVVMKAVSMAEEDGDVRQLVASTMIAGMLFTQNGCASEGLPLLERADRTAGDLRTGMHRHRPKYMLADALIWLGRYEEARPLFFASAELSRGAEPHVVGLANAMAALTLLREGRPGAAIDLLESPDGVPNVLEGGVVLSIVAGLGILAETRLALGDEDAALEAVREAESWMTPRDDGTAYFASILGHTAIARVRMATNEPGDPVRRGLFLRTPLESAMARVNKLNRQATGGLAPRLLIQGQYAVHRGKTGKARKLLGRATEAASAASQPYELGRSLVERARISSDTERSDLLDRAVRVFDDHGMALESGWAKALMT